MSKKIKAILPGHIELVERKWQERKNTSKENDESEKQIEEFTTEFVSTISHELKTPLTVIHEGVSLLLEQKLGKLNQGQESCLKLTLQNSKRMLRMVENLLDISRLNLGKFRLHKKVVDLALEVQKVHDQFLPFAEKEQKELLGHIPSSPIFVYVDEDKLMQVLHNLLGNAFKFTESGGEVSLEVYIVGYRARVVVSDTGCGIDQEHLETVFNKFHQVDHGYGPGAKGLGLGLSICREVIDMLGGNIWAESKLGEGSRFIFELPILPEVFEKLLGLAKGKHASQKTKAKIAQELKHKKDLDFLMQILENTAIEADVKEAILAFYQGQKLIVGVVPLIFEHIMDFIRLEILDDKGKVLGASNFKQAFLMAYIEKNMGGYKYKGKPIYDYGDIDQKRIIIMKLVKSFSAKKLDLELCKIQAKRA